MAQKESKLVQALEVAVAKSEAADYEVKYDILYTSCKRLIRDMRPLPPVKNWKDGHDYGSKEEAKD